PVLTTADIGLITQTTARCGGTITSDGGGTITTCGVCWSTDQKPTVSDNKTNDDTGAGTFTSDIAGLIPETTYYVRAYATNIAGTGYGSAKSFTTRGTVTDIDGNVYQTVKIGNQWWMAANLKATHYRNGDEIPNVTGAVDWKNLTTGAYCNYDNNADYGTTYGRLYNWYAVNDSRNIAPQGWHVPTDAQWQTLIDYLGGGNVAGGKMKETETTHWVSPNRGATNESGFSALLGGYRNGYYFYDMGNEAKFWSSTASMSTHAFYRALYNSNSYVMRLDFYKSCGHSVRCIRD
ncbi:hypothetical protein JW835_11430, partial [bacterium]|nr:hypothetical protein [bacterium]